VAASEQWKITLFFKKFFDHWEPRYDVVPRKSNVEALIDLGLTPNQRKKVILALKAGDYFSGPTQERDQAHFGEGEIWEFGVDSNGVSIYIKLKIQESKDRVLMAKCLSFHRAKWIINYPYKENH